MGAQYSTYDTNQSFVRVKPELDTSFVRALDEMQVNLNVSLLSLVGTWRWIEREDLAVSIAMREKQIVALVEALGAVAASTEDPILLHALTPRSRLAKYLTLVHRFAIDSVAAMASLVETLLKGDEPDWRELSGKVIEATACVLDGLGTEARQELADLGELDPEAMFDLDTRLQDVIASAKAARGGLVSAFA